LLATTKLSEPVELTDPEKREVPVFCAYSPTAANNDSKKMMELRFFNNITPPLGTLSVFMAGCFRFFTLFSKKILYYLRRGCKIADIGEFTIVGEKNGKTKITVCAQCGICAKVYPQDILYIKTDKAA
jgi:ferredoxin